jgi:DNA-directed RNA polymerase subunit RPC12/RpoP
LPFLGRYSLDLLAVSSLIVRALVGCETLAQVARGENTYHRDTETQRKIRTWDCGFRILIASRKTGFRRCKGIEILES